MEENFEAITKKEANVGESNVQDANVGESNVQDANVQEANKQESKEQEAKEQDANEESESDSDENIKAENYADLDFPEEWELVHELPARVMRDKIYTFYKGKELKTEIKAKVDKEERAYRLRDELVPMRASLYERLNRYRRGPEKQEIEGQIIIHHATFKKMPEGANWKSKGFWFSLTDQLGQKSCIRREDGLLLYNAEIYMDKDSEGDKLWKKGEGMWGIVLRGE